jgi:hypothetical protein
MVVLVRKEEYQITNVGNLVSETLGDFATTVDGTTEGGRFQAIVVEIRVNRFCA